MTKIAAILIEDHPIQAEGLCRQLCKWSGITDDAVLILTSELAFLQLCETNPGIFRDIRLMLLDLSFPVMARHEALPVSGDSEASLKWLEDRWSGLGAMLTNEEMKGVVELKLSGMSHTSAGLRCALGAAANKLPPEKIIFYSAFGSDKLNALGINEKDNAQHPLAGARLFEKIGGYAELEKAVKAIFTH